MSEEIGWWNAAFGEEESSSASKVILSNYLNEGKLTREFEKRVAERFKVKHVHAVPNGTLALSLSLWALGIGHADEVLIPDLTFIATGSAVHLVGATPVLVDINEHDFNIDINDLKSKITPKTKAIIVVHINGRPCNLEALSLLSRETGLPIIEDSAQAMGSEPNGQQLGTTFAMGAISLAPSKVISSGQGGLIVTNDDKLSENVIRLKDHGRLSRSEAAHMVPGYNFKFTDLQAAVGLEQFKKLDHHLEKAKQDYLKYQNGFRSIDGIELVDFNFESGAYPLWIDAIAERRDELLTYLEKENIFARPFWEPLHHSWIGGKNEDFPITTSIAQKGFWLPSGPICSNEAIDTVIKKVQSFFS